MALHLEDFAYIYKGSVVRPLPKEEAHLLLPIDKKFTEKHDRALLFLHGYASSPAVYRALIPQIKGYDRIVCPILPGHCDSIHAFSKAKIKDWRQIAKKHCEELVGAYQQVSIVGLSLGGLLAIELSQSFQLHHLYLLSPSVQLKFSASIALFCAHLLQKLGVKSIVNYGGDFFAKGYQEISYRRLPLSSLIEILSLIKEQTYPQPHCTSDLFLGKYDKVIDSRSIAKAYAHQPQIRIHWLEHSAHVLPLDGDIQLLSQSINKL